MASTETTKISSAEHLGSSKDKSATLCNAMHSNNFSQVKRLLRSGVSPNNDKECFMCLCIKQGCPLKMAELLVSYGFDVNRPTRIAEDTCLTKAVIHNRIDVLESLLKHGAEFDSRWHVCSWLRTALRRDCHQAVEAYVKRGGDVTMKYKNFTILHECALYDSFRTATYLVDKAKVNVNAVDCNGKSPLFLAAQYGNHKCLRALLRLGCEMYTKNKSSVCALEAAVMNGHLDCAQTLLLAGCHWQPLIVRLLSKFERGHIRIKRCDKMVPFLRTQNGRVERLENLCREKVRQTLGVVTKADYKMLPLPKIMIETNYLYNGL